jgi:polyisoprenyl-teichoic acid--peptidoglycan teichoic acid transferase
MNPDDPLIRRVSAINPVPDPEALGPEQRAAADRLRAQTTVTPRRPAWRLRRSAWIRQTAMALAIIVPVAAVLIVVLGVHHRTSVNHGRGGSGVLHLPSAGTAQTLLLIGSDHRAGEPYSDANTDAMMLVRLNPDAPTINLLSVPRDLEVRIPGGGTQKLNAVYSIGGPSLLLKILGTQVFPGLTVNHVIDFDFQGFSRLVDALGCAYGDIDHRYVNDTAQTDYSSIDLEAGYQRLCGAQALQFVRFRHTDTSLVRDARQQDFLRWLSDDFTVGDLLSRRDRLLAIIGRYSQTDSGLHSVSGLLRLFDAAVKSAGHPFEQIPFPATLPRCAAGESCPFVTATRGAEAAAYRRFLATGRSPASSSSAGTAHLGGSDRGGAVNLVQDVPDGQAQATALGALSLPVYYPSLIVKSSRYCSDASGNCRVAPNPPSRYVNAYPRAYQIQAGGHRYPSYRMTLVLNAALGQYYGVQGTTWSDPPILRHPAATQVVNGRQLREYGTGGELSLVAFSTSTGTYWISNTLTDSIPNAQLIAIAASLRPAG